MLDKEYPKFMHDLTVVSGQMNAHLRGASETCTFIDQFRYVFEEARSKFGNTTTVSENHPLGDQ